MKRIISLVLAVLFFMLAFNVTTAVADAYSSTPVGSSKSAYINNLKLATEAIDGTYVEYGDTFSFNDIVGPRSEEAGYKKAINGRGVEARGGGVAQVASTLYLALKKLGSDIKYIEKHTYGDDFNQDYVSNEDDAIVTDYSADTDFSFKNNYGDFTIYMEYDGREDEVCCTLICHDDYEAYPEYEGNYEYDDYEAYPEYEGNYESSASSSSANAGGGRSAITSAVIGGYPGSGSGNIYERKSTPCYAHGCKGGKITCTSCDGTGRIEWLQSVPNYGSYGGPALMTVEKICISCYGLGYRECIYCDGDGIID